mmetsp:Transcript_20826/g.49124  ORF Transcript_20826/g.49124 Transcript_20826/m.49124 type:complete len:138 (-) Transcript_20826:154-567(-)
MFSAVRASTRVAGSFAATAARAPKAVVSESFSLSRSRPLSLSVASVRAAPAFNVDARAFSTGTVKWFNVNKGYGFIVPDEEGRDLFVHQTAILSEGFRYLREGERVSFDLVETDRGTQASNVTDEAGNRFNRDLDDE